MKNLGLTFGVVPSNGGSLVISLLEALYEAWTFSRVKTQGLTMLVRLDVDGVAHCYLLGGFVLEKIFQRGCVVTTSGAFVCARLCLLQRGLFLLFLLLLLFGCVQP